MQAVFCSRGFRLRANTEPYSPTPMDPNFPNPYQQPFHPPLPSEASPESRWHKPLGIVGIIFGAGAALMGLFGLIMVPIQKKILGAAGVMDGVSPGHMFIQNYVVLPLAIALGGLLLAGSIQLLRRRPVAKTLILTWAALKIILIIGSAPSSYAVGKGAMQAQTAQMEQTASSSKMPQAEKQIISSMGGFMDSMIIVSVIFQILWGCAFPIFQLIWFNRKKIRLQVQAWNSLPQPGNAWGTP
jgi:hypothetical protein